jgi:hypothetical protein
MDFNFGAEGYGTQFKNAVKEGVYQISLGRLWRVAGALGQLRGD